MIEALQFVLEDGGIPKTIQLLTNYEQNFELQLIDRGSETNRYILTLYSPDYKPRPTSVLEETANRERAIELFFSKIREFSEKGTPDEVINVYTHPACLVEDMLSGSREWRVNRKGVGS